MSFLGCLLHGFQFFYIFLMHSLISFHVRKSHLKWFRTAVFYCSSASRGNQRGQFGHPYNRRQRIDLELKDRHAVSNAPSLAWEGTCVCPLNYLEIGQEWWWNWSCFPICKNNNGTKRWVRMFDTSDTTSLLSKNCCGSFSPVWRLADNKSAKSRKWRPVIFITNLRGTGVCLRPITPSRKQLAKKHVGECLGRMWDRSVRPMMMKPGLKR